MRTKIFGLETKMTKKGNIMYLLNYGVPLSASSGVGYSCSTCSLFDEDIVRKIGNLDLSSDYDIDFIPSWNGQCTVHDINVVD